MKKRAIILAAILAALLLAGFRYSVVEQEDVLPDEVRLSLNRLLGIALAEETPYAEENAPDTELPDVAEMSMSAPPTHT